MIIHKKQKTEEQTKTQKQQKIFEGDTGVLELMGPYMSFGTLFFLFFLILLRFPMFFCFSFKIAVFYNVFWVFFMNLLCFTMFFLFFYDIVMFHNAFLVFPAHWLASQPASKPASQPASHPASQPGRRVR